MRDELTCTGLATLAMFIAAALEVKTPRGVSRLGVDQIEDESIAE
jgi:hypothetical protein